MRSRFHGFLGLHRVCVSCELHRADVARRGLQPTRFQAAPQGSRRQHCPSSCPCGTSNWASLGPWAWPATCVWSTGCRDHSRRHAAIWLRGTSCFCAISATVLLFARGHCRDFALKARGSFRRGLRRTLPGLCPRRMEQPLHFWSWSGLPCRLSPARRGGCRAARCCAGRSSNRPEGGRRRPGCRG